MFIHIARKKRATAVALTAVLVLIGGLAFAYWTSSGEGTGHGTTGSSTDLEVTSPGPIGLALTPGGPSQSIPFTVANPGTGTQDLTSVTVVVADENGETWVSDPVGCTAADYTLGTPVITYDQIPGGGSISGTVTLTMNNLDSSQDACKGLDVPLYFAAS
jgi:hypothetical protein